MIEIKDCPVCGEKHALPFSAKCVASLWRVVTAYQAA
jgi:hypothetical protein